MLVENIYNSKDIEYELSFQVWKGFHVLHAWLPVCFESCKACFKFLWFFLSRQNLKLYCYNKVCSKELNIVTNLVTFTFFVPCHSVRYVYKVPYCFTYSSLELHVLYEARFFGILYMFLFTNF